MDSKTKEAIKQLQVELRQLQTQLNQPRGEGREEPSSVEISSASRGKDKPEKEKGGTIIEYTVEYQEAGGNGPNTYSGRATASQIMHVTNEASAGLGYALSSPQKVGLLRALLNKESESAATLGAATHLSTGSLYHHLRDLMHAGLIGQSGRNRYVLSERGVRVLLLFLALASEA